MSKRRDSAAPLCHTYHTHWYSMLTASARIVSLYINIAIRQARIYTFLCWFSVSFCRARKPRNSQAEAQEGNCSEEWEKSIELFKNEKSVHQTRISSVAYEISEKIFPAEEKLLSTFGCGWACSRRDRLEQIKRIIMKCVEQYWGAGTCAPDSITLAPNTPEDFSPLRVRLAGCCQEIECGQALSQ